MHRPMPTSGKAKSTKSTILSAEEALPSSSPAAGAVLVGYHQDPLAYLADLIIQRHVGALPDLTHCVVLLPDTLAAPRLRRHLLAAAARHGVAALLGPQILSLRSYAAHHTDGDGVARGGGEQMAAQARRRESVGQQHDAVREVGQRADVALDDQVGEVGKRVLVIANQDRASGGRRGWEGFLSAQDSRFCAFCLSTRRHRPVHLFSR